MRAAVAQAVLLGLCGAFAGAAATAAPPQDVNGAFEEEFGEGFLDAWWQLHPHGAIAAGYYRYADRLIVPDARARGTELRFAEEWLRRLDRYAPETLDDGNRTDHAILRNELQALRWQLTELREWQWNPAQYNVAEPFALLLGTEYAPLDERLRTVLQRLAAVPAYYDAARASIHRPTREHLQLGVQQNRGALDVFGEPLEREVAGSGLSAEERTLFLRRIEAARHAIEGYADWLQELDARLGQDQVRSFRLGQPLYDRKFGYVIQSTYSPLELYRRALAEKEQLHARMARDADVLWSRYFPDEPPPADRLDRIGRLIARLSQRHVAPQDFIAEVKRQIPLLERWVIEHDLLDLDPSRPLQVRETPRYQRGVAIASINPPGPYNPTANTYYNVSPLDDHTAEQAESFLREYNHWIMQVLNIHEAVPGHYVQLLYSNRSPSLIKSIFGNGAMIEGWAVYAERMMLESGWGGDAPEMWLMYSKWNLRVVCNAILDYSVHVLGMSEDEALELLMREAFQSEAEARGKWRRVKLTSVQLTSYFAGFAEILDLREQRRQMLGERFDLKRFHEQFLSFGSAPVSVIRSLMGLGAES